MPSLCNPLLGPERLRRLGALTERRRRVVAVPSMKSGSRRSRDDRSSWTATAYGMSLQ